MKIEIEIAGDPSLPLNRALAQLRTVGKLLQFTLPTAILVQLWHIADDPAGSQAIHFEIEDGTVGATRIMAEGRLVIRNGLS